MIVTKTRSELQAQLDPFYRDRQTISLVPTMGNLHAGHLSLVDLAKQQADKVVVTIFVNPMQFAVHEDLNSYPRTLTEDYEKLTARDVDLVFSPTTDELYPESGSSLTQVISPFLSNCLCGQSRPHFFPGIATVVLKIFNLIKPQIAIFGEKDFQQLLVIKQIVKDFFLPIQIMAAPIVREPNGLAMSSRNNYLTFAEKEQAAFLYQLLTITADAIRAGNRDFSSLEQSGLAQLRTRGFIPDYFEIRQEEDLAKAKDDDQPKRIFVAATLNTTRLIDNRSF